MNIYAEKIPLKFSNLPETVVLLKKHGSEALDIVMGRVAELGGKPSSSNATFEIISKDLYAPIRNVIIFKFYNSPNPFTGHNVISNAENGYQINYNHRFHSVSNFKVRHWFCNFFHEWTHLADDLSPFHFGHKNQKDKKAAPFIVAEIAGQVFDEKKDLWGVK
jgi:hypothetical protein